MPSIAQWYCQNLKLKKAQENKFISFQNRAMKIIAKIRAFEIIQQNNAFKRIACMLVQKCPRVHVCHAIRQYVTYKQQSQKTRSKSACFP